MRPGNASSDYLAGDKVFCLKEFTRKDIRRQGHFMAAGAAHPHHIGPTGIFFRLRVYSFVFFLCVTALANRREGKAVILALC